MMEITRNWWRHEGSREVNKELINLIGEDLGYIPLRNLLEDITDIPIKKIEEILSDLVNDGLTIKRVTYQGGRDDIFVFVK